jgi:hypothetical protein
MSEAAIAKLLENEAVVEELKARTNARLTELLEDEGEAVKDGSLASYLVLLLRNKRTMQEVHVNMQELLLDEHVTGAFFLRPATEPTPGALPAGVRTRGCAATLSRCLPSPTATPFTSSLPPPPQLQRSSWHGSNPRWWR